MEDAAESVELAAGTAREAAPSADEEKPQQKITDGELSAEGAQQEEARGEAGPLRSEADWAGEELEGDKPQEEQPGELEGQQARPTGQAGPSGVQAGYPKAKRKGGNKVGAKAWLQAFKAGAGLTRGCKACEKKAQEVPTITASARGGSGHT